MKNKYPLYTRLKRQMEFAKVIIATYPNGEIGLAARNKVGTFRMFSPTCFRWAIRFSNGYANEDKY